MPTVDDLAERLDAACANHIRFHNRVDPELLDIRRKMWATAAHTIEVLIEQRVEARLAECPKIPRKRRK